MPYLAADYDKMTTSGARISEFHMWYIPWIFSDTLSNYTLAYSLTGSFQWLFSIVLVHFIDHQSVNDCFHPLQSRIANDGMDVLCMLAVQFVYKTALSQQYYKPQSPSWLKTCKSTLVKKGRTPRLLSEPCSMPLTIMTVWR